MKKKQRMRYAVCQHLPPGEHWNQPFICVDVKRNVSIWRVCPKCHSKVQRFIKALEK